MDPTRDNDETLPPAIAARLRALDRAEPILDPRTDRAVLDAARAQFGSRPARSARRARRRWAVPFAAAATLLLAAILLRPLGVDVARDRDDVDGSGRVDILDVLALARMRAEGGAGVTDASVESLAYRIVALDAPRGRP